MGGGVGLVIYPSRLRWIGFLIASLLFLAWGIATTLLAPAGLLRAGGLLGLIPFGLALVAITGWVVARRQPSLVLTPRGIWRFTGLMSPYSLVPWSAVTGVRLHRAFRVTYLVVDLAREMPPWLNRGGSLAETHAQVQVSEHELDRPADEVVELVSALARDKWARNRLPEWEPRRRRSSR